MVFQEISLPKPETIKINFQQGVLRKIKRNKAKIVDSNKKANKMRHFFAFKKKMLLLSENISKFCFEVNIMHTF